MKITALHRWDLTTGQAVDLQRKLANKLSRKCSLKKIRTIAGADVSLDRKNNMGYAGVIVYSYPELKVLEKACAQRPLRFPYVPGLLSFREGPILLEVFSKLKNVPDVIIFDGHGIAHPRGIGIASHMGLWLNRPTIGLAKSLLVGQHKTLGQKAGATQTLFFKGRQVGIALRTRNNNRPVFVSPGHQMDFKTALSIMKSCLDGRRIPKPTREADRFVAGMK